LSSKIFGFPKGKERSRLEKQVVYLKQDVIDTRRRDEKRKRGNISIRKEIEIE